MSYGENLLSRFLNLTVHHKYVRNHRPTWLGGLELDFWFPDLGIGVEFQGDQHLADTEFGNCSQQKRRDREKVRICRQRRVPLIVVYAVDLEYTRIRSKFKKLLRGRSRLLEVDHRILRPLNEDATRYRQALIQRFDSATSRREGNTRTAAVERLNVKFGSFRSVNVERFGH